MLDGDIGLREQRVVRLDGDIEIRHRRAIRGATGLGSFAWFYRERQKLWDGVTGIALACATGRSAVDVAGSPLTPIAPTLLEDSEPAFTTTVVAVRSELQDVLSLLSSNG